MIKNREKLQKFERDQIKKEKVNLLQNFHIVNALYKEAIALGRLPMKNVLEGLEVDLKIARVVNSVSKSPLT